MRFIPNCKWIDVFEWTKTATKMANCIQCPLSSLFCSQLHPVCSSTHRRCFISWYFNWLIVGLFVTLTTFNLLDSTTVCLCSRLSRDASAMRSVLVQVWRYGQVALKSVTVHFLHSIIIYREFKAARAWVSPKASSTEVKHCSSYAFTYSRRHLIKRSDLFILTFRFAIKVEHIPLLLAVAGPSVLLNN